MRNLITKIDNRTRGVRVEIIMFVFLVFVGIGIFAEVLLPRPENTFGPTYMLYFLGIGVSLGMLAGSVFLFIDIYKNVTK